MATVRPTGSAQACRRSTCRRELESEFRDPAPDSEILRVVCSRRFFAGPPHFTFTGPLCSSLLLQPYMTPIFDSDSSTVFYVGDSWYGKIVAFHLDTRRAQELEVPGLGLKLLAETRESNGFLIAYAVTGSCNIEDTSEGEDPTLIPSSVEYRTQHRPMHVCFGHLPD